MSDSEPEQPYDWEDDQPCDKELDRDSDQPCDRDELDRELVKLAVKLLSLSQAGVNIMLRN